MKKVFVFTLLALAATAAISGNEVPKNKAELMKKIKAQLKVQFPKRDADTCAVAKCAKEGEACDVNTTCQYPTGCVNGVCASNVIGDTCDDEVGCYNSSLYCSSSEKVCVKIPQEGDTCDGSCSIGFFAMYYCSSVDHVCKSGPSEVGDYCEYGTTFFCPSGSYCTGTADSVAGKCEALPETVGADCSVTKECNEGKGVYCDTETNKCVGLPTEGESCYSGSVCNVGLYCDYTSRECAPLKSLGDECDYSRECAEGLTCAGTGKCVKSNPGKGEYCESSISCSDDYVCVNNVCAEKDGTCSSDDDCPDFYSYYCDEDKTCKGHMGISEGGKCTIGGDDPRDITSLFIASLQCNEGLACVPNEHGGTEGKCQKVTTKAEDKKACSSDDDCSVDAICDCNDITGDMQCLPIPTAKSEGLAVLGKFYNKMWECYDGQSTLEAATCMAIIDGKIYQYIGESVYPYNHMYRCADYSLIPDASSEEPPSPVASSEEPPSPVASTNIVKVVLNKGGMEKSEVEEIVKGYLPQGTKCKIDISDENDGKTTVVIEFDNAETAKGFVDALNEASEGVKSLIEDIGYLDNVPGSASVTFPRFLAFLAIIKMFF